ncbi:MAG: hypothetical protein MHM6MM_001518 [Cercozoa sp. M6MM]
MPIMTPLVFLLLALSTFACSATVLLSGDPGDQSQELLILDSRVLPPENAIVPGKDHYRVYVLFTMHQVDQEAYAGFSVRVQFGECTLSPQPPNVPVPLTLCAGYQPILTEIHEVDFPAVSNETAVLVGALFNLTSVVSPKTLGMEFTLFNTNETIGGPFFQPPPVVSQFNELNVSHSQLMSGQVEFSAVVSAKEATRNSLMFSAVGHTALGFDTTYTDNDGSTTVLTARTAGLPCCTTDVSVELAYLCLVGPAWPLQLETANRLNVSSTFFAKTTIYSGLEASSFTVLPEARGWAFHLNHQFIPDPSFTNCSSIFQSLKYRDIFLNESHNECAYGVKTDSTAWSHGSAGSWDVVTGQSLPADTIIVEMPYLLNAFYLTHPNVTFGMGHSSMYFSQPHFELADTKALGAFEKANYTMEVNTKSLAPNCVDEISANVTDFANLFGKPLESHNFSVDCFNIGDAKNRDKFVQWLRNGIGADNKTLRRSVETLPPDVYWQDGFCQLRFSALNWIYRDWQEHGSVPANEALEISQQLRVYESELSDLVVDVQAPSQHRRRNDLLIQATVLEYLCGRVEGTAAPAGKYNISYTLTSAVGSHRWHGAQAVIPHDYLPKRSGVFSIRIDVSRPDFYLPSVLVEVELLLDAVVAAVAGGELRVLPNPQVELQADFAAFSYDPNGIYDQSELQFKLSDCRTQNGSDCTTFFLSAVNTTLLEHTGLLHVPADALAPSEQYDLTVNVSVPDVPTHVDSATVPLSIRVDDSLPDNLISVSVQLQSVLPPLVSQQDVLRIEGTVVTEKSDAVIRYQWYEVDARLDDVSPAQLLTPLDGRNLAIDAFALPPGEYRFRLNASDTTYGAFSMGEARVVVVDAPVISQTLANQTSSDTVNLSVVATVLPSAAPMQVRWWVDLSNEGSETSLTDWSTRMMSTVSLPTGDHTVHVQVRDSVGGVATASTTVAVVSSADQCEVSLNKLAETRASGRVSDALLAVIQVTGSHLYRPSTCPGLSQQVLLSLALFRQVHVYSATECAHPEAHLLAEAMRLSTQLFLQLGVSLHASDFDLLVGEQGMTHDLLCAVDNDFVHDTVRILAQTGATLSNTLALATASLNGAPLCYVTHQITEFTTELLIAKLAPALAGEHPEYAEFDNVFGAGAKFDAGTRVTLSGEVQVEVPENAFENPGEVSVTVSALDSSLSTCFAAENSASPDDTCSVTDINAQNGALRDITFALTCSDQHQYRVDECERPHATCRWFDSGTHSWRQDGCRTVSVTPSADGVHTVYQCRCEHLTTFAMVKEMTHCRSSESGVYVPFAGTFGFVALLAVGQSVRYVAATRAHKRSKGLVLQHAGVVVVALARVAACIYLESKEDPSVTVTVVLLSVPMCLVYWAFTYVVVQWAGIIHFAMSHPGDPTAKLRRVFFPVNLALAAILVVTIAVASTGNDAAADAGSVIVASVSLLTAVGFIVYGTLLLRQMSRSQQMGSTSDEKTRVMRQAARRLFLVTLLTSLAFIVQSVVVLWSVSDTTAFSDNSNAFQAVYWSAEALTLLLLLFLYLSLVRRSVEEKRTRTSVASKSTAGEALRGTTQSPRSIAGDTVSRTDVELT